MSVTVNTFPPVHVFNSPRAWAMAIIVLIHLGFFWALTSGLAHTIVTMVIPPSKVVVVEPEPVKPPPRVVPADPVIDEVYVPPILTPTRIEDPATQTAPLHVARDPADLLPPISTEAVRPSPVEVEPQIDARHGLSEPVYPASVIRMGGEGTVVLSVQVLANGRVGEVRIERSSGNPKLDESAAREAKRWRLIPGTRDGVPVVLWKQIPIRFRLQGR